MSVKKWAVIQKEESAGRHVRACTFFSFVILSFLSNEGQEPFEKLCRIQFTDKWKIYVHLSLVQL